jgi:hypothetical protein
MGIGLLHGMARHTSLLHRDSMCCAGRYSDEAKQPAVHVAGHIWAALC